MKRTKQSIFGGVWDWYLTQERPAGRNRFGQLRNVSEGLKRRTPLVCVLDDTTLETLRGVLGTEESVADLRFVNATLAVEFPFNEDFLKDLERAHNLAVGTAQVCGRFSPRKFRKHLKVSLLYLAGTHHLTVPDRSIPLTLCNCSRRGPA
jgi:hypothetical protein